jgi:hypothetical protein
MTTPIIKPIGPGLNTGKDSAYLSPKVAPPSPIAGPTRAQVAQQALSVPAGLVPFTFTFTSSNPGTQTRGYRIITGADGTGGRQLESTLIFRGSIVAMAFSSDFARTAGTESFEALINGTQSARIAWTTNVMNDYAVFTPNLYPFNAGDRLTVLQVVGSDFLPQAMNIEVTVYVTQASAT